MENDVKSFDFGVELLEKSGQIPMLFDGWNILKVLLTCKCPSFPESHFVHHRIVKIHPGEINPWVIGILRYDFSETKKDENGRKHYQSLSGSVSKPCTPFVHIKIAGIYGCSSP